MPAPSTAVIPITIDLRPAADALDALAASLEVTAGFLKSKAIDLREAAPSEHYRALGERLLEEARVATEELEDDTVPIADHPIAGP